MRATILVWDFYVSQLVLIHLIITHDLLSNAPTTRTQYDLQRKPTHHTLNRVLIVPVRLQAAPANGWLCIGASWWSIFKQAAQAAVASAS